MQLDEAELEPDAADAPVLSGPAVPQISPAAVPDPNSFNPNPDHNPNPDPNPNPNPTLTLTLILTDP